MNNNIFNKRGAITTDGVRSRRDRPFKEMHSLLQTHAAYLDPSQRLSFIVFPFCPLFFPQPFTHPDTHP